MDSLLAMLGTLFFLFLSLAAAVEVILEMFRGLLEWLGITWIKGKVSLEDALKFADEFAPGHSDLKIKLQAVKTAAEQISGKIKGKLESLESISAKLDEAGVDVGAVTRDLSDMAFFVKAELEKSERKRVFVLRTLAAVIGCGLAGISEFYVFRILANSPQAKEFLGNVGGAFVVGDGILPDAVNIIVGGLAAAAGSSYWHDRLDRVRNLKSVVQELKKIAA